MPSTKVHPSRIALFLLAGAARKYRLVPGLLRAVVSTESARYAACKPGGASPGGRP